LELLRPGFTDTTEAAMGNGAKVVAIGDVALGSLIHTGATSLAAAASLGGKVDVTSSPSKPWCVVRSVGILCQGRGRRSTAPSAIASE
jgi:hypothetical protein